MSDPRNVAHDKKVIQEKKHDGEVAADDAAAMQPGKKARAKKEKPETAPAAPSEGEGEGNAPAASPNPVSAANLEESRKVLAKLKDMEHHSRTNIEHLAGLLLTVEDELKQKEFSAQLNEVYSAQDAFQTKITALIESYKAMVNQAPGA